MKHVALLITVLFSLLSHSAFSQVAPPSVQPFVETFDQQTDSLPVGWNVIEGNWRIADGAIVADSLQEEAYLAIDQSYGQNYQISADVVFRKVRDPKRWLSVLVRANRDGATPWSQVAIRFDTTQSNGAEFAVRTPENSWSVRSRSSAAVKSTLNQKRQLKVIVQGSHVQGFLDSQPVVDSHFCVDRSVGCVGLGVSGCVAAFDHVSVQPLPNTVLPTRSTVTAQKCDNVAHRGFSSKAPENTLAAIQEAINAGATGCEFDVYRSADGNVVLMHDKTVDRTTNGTGKVTGLTLKQLQKLDAGSWKDEQYSGEPVPTLIEALTLLKNTKCQPVIEIKMEGISQQVVDDVRSLGMIQQVAIIAFSQKVVRRIETLEPEIQCAWLCGGFPKQISQGAVSQQADWLQSEAKACKAEILDLNYRMLSPELITELKRRRLNVWCWTVNESPIMKALYQWGVDSITTDRPDELLQVLEKSK